ncbi:E3 ubiquitin-protein ligase CCNB1IP1 [Diretmus argenteus]
MAMSLCDDTLKCNFPKCRVNLYGFAWVTACSHAFCDRHGSGEFSRSPAACPACSSPLPGKLDIVRTELAPSEEYRAMVLSGLRPEVILDISTRALTFWSYQIHQEQMYQEYSLSRADAQVKQMEKILKQQKQNMELELTAMRGEISSMKKVMEEYRRQYSEVSERLMERNRQYQKLQGLYDSLRLRHMVVDVGERDAPLQQAHHHREYNRVVRPATPERSPAFLPVVPEADGCFFSCLEPDTAKTFFQLRSPIISHRERPYLKKH